MDVDVRTKSAIIIQRNFRKYLNKQAQTKLIFGDNSMNIDYPENFVVEQTGCGDADQQWVQEIQNQIQEVYGSLAIFYKSLPNTFDRNKYIDAIIAEIEGIIQHFPITNIGQCENIPEEAYNSVDEAQQKHQEALHELNIKWWENLDVHK